MKRLAIYLIIAALGFFVGLLAHKLWRASLSSSEINKPLAISLCELELNPERYNEKFIQVKAVLYRNQGEPFISDESCEPSNAHMSRLVMVSEDANLLPVLPRWATYISFCGNDPNPSLVNGLSAEVIITGTFEAGYRAPNNAYGNRRSQIIARSVLQFSPASNQH